MDINLVLIVNTIIYRTYDFPSWLDYIADSLFLSVEAVPIECTDFDFFSEESAENFGAHCQHCHWCFTRWKDYVIPGFVEARRLHDRQVVEVYMTTYCNYYIEHLT